MREVGGGFKHSKYKGSSMLKKLAMMRVKYGLEYHFCNDRAEMARYIEEIFQAIVRCYRKVGVVPVLNGGCDE